MSSKPPLPGPRRLGRYALHGELASGGMAVVHFGRLLGPVGFSRTVAIKRLHAHLAKDAGFRAMFLDEARLAARVRHPNVVPILDVVDDESELYLVMEYVHGESFDRLLRGAVQSGAGIPVAIAVGVMRDALHGLHAAHEATSERGKALGIVHRDISPHNLLVGIDGVARVHDFGVAKAQARLQLTTEGQLKGKIAYMAPEQVEQTGVDRRADIWSASVVLWEALTGKRLFTGDHPAQLMKLVLSMPIARPTEVVMAIPTVLADLVMRGLDRDRDRRFVSAHEMAVLLDDTGLCAPQHVIGEWVQQIAANALRQRARVIAEIEGSATATGMSLELPAAEPEAPDAGSGSSDADTLVASSADSRVQTLIATSVTNAQTQALPRASARTDSGRRRILPFVAVAAIAAAAGAAAVAVMQSESPAPAPDAPSAITSLVAPPIARSEAPAVPAPVELAIADAATPAKKPVRKPVNSGRRPAATATAKPTSARDCNPPWTVDKYGVQVPKLHCLQK